LDLEKERQKAFRRITIIARDPKIFQMAREYFGDPALPSVALPNEIENSAERRNRGTDLLAIFFGLLGWWYTVLNPEPSIYVSGFLLLLCLGFGLSAVWAYRPFKTFGKIATALVAVVLFAFLLGVYRYEQIVTAQTKLSEKQTAQRLETQRLLTATVTYEPTEDLSNSVFTYSNGGSDPITISNIKMELNHA
jgi:hypothetical protein